jgi:Domain of unknown function (DUF4340)
MNSKTTGIWFVIAAALFAFIFFFQRYHHSAAVGPSPILPDLQPAAVTNVQVIPADAPGISAVRANGGWLLTKPIFYPAQSAAIETLLDALQKLTSAIQLTGTETHEGNNANADFGFVNPLTLAIQQGQDRWQLLVGNKTAPGDQVYLRVVGVAGVFVADAGWLKLIPHSADDWRDTSLVDFNGGAFDWILLTNNARNITIELRRDPTNHLWRMLQPLAARANNDFINDALQRLQAARVSQFVSDDPRADLSAFGLQPANLNLWLGRGTNLMTGLLVGKSPTNDALRVFAKRASWNAVVTTTNAPLQPWRGAVNDFRDPYLLELTAPVAEVAVSGDHNFTLQRQGSNLWQVARENFPVDDGSVQQFIQTLAGLRVSEFVKDVVTPHDLSAYGLTNPVRQITLRSAVGDTNAVIAQLLFGATQTNKVFVRRADEDSVYAVSLEDFNRLPDSGWEFRERRIWDFTNDEIAQITIHENGKTRQVIRNGPNNWSFASGSQGIIVPSAIEETAYRLGKLDAVGWVARDVTNPAPYGFKPDNLSLTVELKNGKKYTVDFGGTVPPETALAAVTLDGERWVFVFPPALYQLVLSYLTIPANTP